MGILKNNDPERVQARVSLLTAADRAYWSRKLSCSEQDLEKAVRSIGNSAAAVDMFLELNRLKLK